MDMQTETEVLSASFDIVARQDQTEQAVTTLRSDVDEMKARLDRVSRAAARPALNGVRADTPEVKGFVDGYLRRGREAEIKSISGLNPSDGGYAVPKEIDALIASQLKQFSPIRQIAQIVQVGTSDYRKLVTTGGTASGWVAEADGRVETATPQFQEVAPPSGELYANPAATQTMLDDAAFDLEGWIASEIAMEFARAEGAAFVGGTHLADPEDDTMQSFDDVLYPLALGRDATVSPEFSTSVSVTASGYERRSSQWTDARLRYDVGPGIRSDAELGILISFFRARRGAARGFRLADPFDFSSNGMTAAPTMVDQLLGVGDGLAASFRLVKSYGDPADPQVRPISRPREGAVLVSVDGVATTAFTLESGGLIVFDAAPVDGAAVRAGFLFDVPVRFAEDRLDISGAAFAAGEAPSVPLIEVREAA